MADSSRHKMMQVLEVTYGLEPATPAYDIIRHTGTTLGLSKESSASQELHDDRQIKCFRHGMRQVGGDINIEFAAEAFDDQLEAVLGGTWATDMLTTGVLRRSFSIVRHFTDLEAGDKPFHVFTGCEYNTLNLSVTPNGIVTGAFGIVGQDLNLFSTATAGSSEVAAPTDCPFTGFSGTINEGGIAIGIVTEIALTLDNGLTPRPVVGDDKTLEPTIGMSDLTGTMTVYFEDSVMLEKFIDETASSVDFSLEFNGKTYLFDMPNVIYTGGQPDVSGEGAITLAMPFQALFDEGAGHSFEITRTLV